MENDNVLTDMNALYKAFLASKKSSAWKPESQKVETDFLSELVKIKHELERGEYQPGHNREFVINERGKTRVINASPIRDRIVQHVLCDDVLDPVLSKHLIPNNGASRKGKGISFTRKMFERDLHNFWLQHRSNNGYVAFIDFSKFYDNIQHKRALDAIAPKIPAEAAEILRRILQSFEVDVSYLSDDEFAACLSEKYNSLDYLSVPAESKTGEKWMAKSVNIGDQVSQNIGIFFPSPIDNYAKIVRGCKMYGRYMDDIYIIDRSKDFLGSVIDGITEQAEHMGLFINTQKTRIVPLRDTFQFLQVRYSLTDTGRVIHRVNPKNLTRMRRRLKAYKRLLDSGKLGYSDIAQSYKSWMGNFAPIMSRQQIKNMKNLYFDLFGRDERWKKILKK